MEPWEDPKIFTLRRDRNVSEQKRLGSEIPESMVNVYIINGLADENDTQYQLLDSNDVVTRGKINSMIAAR